MREKDNHAGEAKVHGELFRALATKADLSDPLVKWVLKSDYFTSFAARNNDDRIVENAANTARLRGVPTAQVEMLYAWVMEIVSYGSGLGLNEETVETEIVERLEEVDLSEWIRRLNPGEYQVIAWVATIFSGTIQPLFDRLSPDAREMLTSSVVRRGSYSPELCRAAGIPDSALFSAMGMPADTGVSFVRFRGIQDEVDLLYTQLQDIEVPRASVEEALLEIEAELIPAAIQTLATVKRSQSWYLVVLLLTLRCPDTERRRFLSVLLPDRIPSIIARYVPVFSRSDVYKLIFLTSPDVPAEAVRALWCVLRDLAEENPAAKEQLVEAVVGGCLQVDGPWAVERSALSSIPEDVVETVARWLENNEDALSTACRIAEFARVLPWGIPDQFELFPQTLFGVLPSIQEDQRAVLRIVLAGLMNRFGEIPDWVTAEDVLSVFGHSSETANHALEILTRTLSEMEPSREKSENADIHAVVIFLAALGGSGFEPEEIEDLLNDYSQRRDIVETIALAERLNVLIQSFPSLISELQRHLSMQDSFDMMIDNAGITFLVCAAILAGVDLSTESTHQKPSAVLVARQMSKGNSFDDALVQLCVAERRPASEEEWHDRINELSDVLRERNLIERVIKKWVEQTPADYEEIDSYLYSFFRLASRLIPDETFLSSKRRLPFEFISLSRKQTAYLQVSDQDAFARLVRQYLSRNNIIVVTDIKDVRKPEFYRDIVLYAALCSGLDSGESNDPRLSVERGQLSRVATLAIHTLRVALKQGDAEAETLLYAAETAAHAATILERLGEGEKAVAPLLLAFRNLQDPAVDEKLWTATHVQAATYSLPARVASTTQFLFATTNNDEGGGQLRTAMVDYLVSQLGKRKNAAPYSEVLGWDAHAIEPYPIWRAAYTRALGDLEANPGGAVHRLLTALAANDPSDEVRDAAMSALESVKQLREAYSNGSHKRTVLNAWWQIRKGHRNALGLAVDAEAANIVRLKEVRR